MKRIDGKTQRKEHNHPENRVFRDILAEHIFKSGLSIQKFATSIGFDKEVFGPLYSRMIKLNYGPSFWMGYRILKALNVSMAEFEERVQIRRQIDERTNHTKHKCSSADRQLGQ